MIAEIGHFALILAFFLSVLLVAVPLWGDWRNNAAALAMAPSLALGLCCMLTVSFVCLATVFLRDDFSVALVASHSNSLLPWYYKISAVWGNHEGSLLLWVLILSLWMSAVALFSPGLPMLMLARVLAVMGAVGVGFSSFSLFTSNPFLRLLPNPPSDGADLNPLLQDPGLIFHPPLLYMGYVGFSVAFAFAIAALMGGRLDAAWARWSRPWTNAAWAFLTLGIALGSWWAYYELGWGGWWFWDPVENASFMPWLVGTALIHSLAATEKRGLFKSWTVLLAIAAFSLSLVGTFLVRSGVLTSVHAFATDPARGVYILSFLAVVVGGSLTLYALRAPAVSSRVSFQALSKESFLLVNNVVLLVAMLTVLFGTLFPLFMDALGQGKYSVGPPYFNTVFVPLMAVLMPFMGLGPAARFKRDTASRLAAELFIPLVAALLLGFILPLFFGASYNIWAALALVLAFWLMFSLIRDGLRRVYSASSVGAGIARLTPSYWGLQLAHWGFALCVIGAVFVSQFSDERDIKMSPGDTQQVAGFSFSFDDLSELTGPNYLAIQADFSVTKNGKLITTLKPQKRRYLAREMEMTETAIYATIFYDIYVAMGEPVGTDGWAIRLHYKPMVRWIWFGALLMAGGAFIAMADKRYRQSRNQGKRKEGTHGQT